MTTQQRYDLNGLPTHAFASVDQLLDYVADQKKILVAINALKIVNATPQTRAIVASNIGYCDGWGAQLALKKKGVRNAIKIPGVELWLHIVERYHATKSFYLLGGRPQVIEGTVAKLRQQFPGINIVGYHDGYINDPELHSQVVDEIVALAPDVVFVAMGSPKQELMMQEIQQRHSALFQGLGGSFDVYTGHARRAPEWWVRHNLEWAYRLLHQPSRIKRDLFYFKFVWNLFTGKI